jgi:hypothetical protein
MGSTFFLKFHSILCSSAFKFLMNPSTPRILHIGIWLEETKGNRAIVGYFFYENLRPNQQLNVIGYKVLLQNLLKLLFLGFFLVICQTGWRILLFIDCFFTFIWPLKVIKTLFTYFNHQSKSITPLNCNMTLIQLVFSRGDTALC